MKPQTAIVKLKLRLNKIDSSDYDNIEDYALVEAVNKSALEIFRNTIHGTTRTQEGSENTVTRIDDLQQFLKPEIIKGSNSKPNYFEAKLPSDFLFWNRIIPVASKDQCLKKEMYSELVEEANVPILLRDYSWQPSFEWRETFHTILSGKIRVYTQNNFIVDHLDTVYYRKPKKMDIHGYTHEDGTISQNVDLEFKDDLAEIVLDYAASIIAGDIESPNQTQITLTRSQVNI